MSVTAVDSMQKIARHIRRRHNAGEVPVILFWKSLVCECVPAYTEIWRRAGRASRKHLKENYPRLRELLEREGIMALKCSDHLGDKRSHGSKPDIDEECNAEWYKSCVPVSHRPGFGVICFPAGAYEDHPFVIATLAKRADEAGNRFVNQVAAIRTARGRELLSADAATGLGHVLSDKALPALASHDSELKQLTGP